MKKLPLILVLGTLGAFPQYALAQTNSGIDQYEENVPTAGGDRPSDGGRTGSGGGAGGSAQGNDGQGQGNVGTGSGDASGSTASGSPSGNRDTGGAGTRTDSSASRQHDGSRQAVDAGVTSGAAEQGSNPIGSAEDSPDEGGMGIVLPIVLGASLVAALAFLVARRLRGRHASPA
jgi:hypothetical protein